MPDDAEAEDPFGVRLEWPEGQRDAYSAFPSQDAAGAPEGGDEASGPEPVVQQQPAVVPGPTPTREVPGSDPSLSEVVVMLARVVARVETLSTATTEFRQLMSDRIGESTARMAQAVTAAAADVAGVRSASERAAAAVRDGLARTDGEVARLAGAIDDLGQIVRDLQADVGTQLAALTQEVQTLRRRTPVRARRETRGE